MELFISICHFIYFEYSIYFE